MINGFRGYPRVRPVVPTKTPEEYAYQRSNLARYRHYGPNHRKILGELPKPESTGELTSDGRTNTYKPSRHKPKKRPHFERHYGEEAETATEHVIKNTRRFDHDRLPPTKSFWEKFKTKIRGKKKK